VLVSLLGLELDTETAVKVSDGVGDDGLVSACELEIVDVYDNCTLYAVDYFVHDAWFKCVGYVAVALEY
jgi:hypothetical protein